MIDEATYDQLDRYFHSAMTEQERSAFESKMSADKQLREEFDWLNNVLGGMKTQGRSVMKQTIATAISGIPSGQVAKYKPSVNGKSFLKKWWWAVTLAVAVGVAVILYSNARVDEGGHYHFFEAAEGRDVPEEDHSETKEFLLADSCFDDSLLKEMSDTTKASQQGARIESEVIVHYDDQWIEVEAPKVMVKGDTSKALAYDVVTLANGAPTGSGHDVSMGIAINNIQKPPYSYQLNETLLLNVNYYSTAGFKFNGAGDTVYMTDLNGQTFMLLRGRGELPLTPMKSIAK